MRWWGYQSLWRVLAIATAWPVLACASFAVYVAREYQKAQQAFPGGNSYFFIGTDFGTFGVTNATITLLALFGPSVFVLLLWRAARRRYPLNEQGHR